MKAADYKQLLRTGRWFQTIPEAMQDALLGAAVVRELPGGTTLFARGDAPDGLYAIVDGALRISGVADSGKEAVLTRIEPPAFFGEVSVFDGLPRTHDAVADGAAIIVHVPQPAIDRIMTGEPRWWRELGLLMAGKTRLAFVAMEEAAVLPPAVRLARRLVMMTDGYGEMGDRTRRVIAVKQAELASMLNLSRQTTNQLLKELEVRRLIRTSYGEIEILDAAGLRAAAADEPDE